MIAVTGVVRGGVQRGVIREGVGSAVFKVTYESFVFMPHKGEVIDAVVKSVNKVQTFDFLHLKHFGLLLMHINEILFIINNCIKLLFYFADGIFCRSWPTANFCIKSSYC